MATIAVYSLKGGVGKTSTAVNLAWAATAISKRRTLLWDLDPQAASSWLLADGKGSRDAAQTVFSKEVDAEKLIQHSTVEGLDLIAADTSLRGLDQLFHEMDKKKRLAKLISGLEKDYQRIILDCPPGLTETSEQVLRAADLVVVPVIPSPLARRALEEVSSHLDRKGGARVPLMPIWSMVDRRRAVHQAALAEHADWPVMPMASAVEQMTVKRKPLGAFAGATPAGKALATLWAEIERRLKAAK